jgi:HD-like signal output (HDOD) protein/GGDEF domain-containing protein
MPLTLEPWLAALLPKAENLPSLPGAALEVLRLCRAEDTTLDDLAAAISRDPALAARLLGFANSSLYGALDEVRTVQRATLVLGMKTVQLMSLSFSLVSTLPRAGSSEEFDYARFWRRSLVRSVSARSLASRVGLLAQDEAFLAGLLGELGQVVLARCAPEAYALVLAETRARGQAWPQAESEREQLGTTHAEVGHALLCSWQVPAHIALAVRHMAAPEELPENSPSELRTLASVLAVARPMTDLLTLEAGEPALGQALELAQRHLGLGAADLQEVLAELDQPLREAASLLEVRLPDGCSHAAILEQARQRLLELSLGQASELNSLRIVLDPEQRAQLMAEPGGHDELTGLASERAFARFLEHQLLARRSGSLARPLGLVLLALDSFEAYPDEEARTEAQRAVAGLLTRVLRRNDLAACLKPGHFGLVLGDATPFGLRALAERLGAEAAGLRLELAHGALIPSLSLGGACLATSRAPADARALRVVVERLLARARQRGPAALEFHAQPLQPSG